MKKTLLQNCYDIFAIEKPNETNKAFIKYINEQTK